MSSHCISPRDTEDPFEALKSSLLLKVNRLKPKPTNKISIVGAGKVGTAIAINLLTKNLTKHIVLIDNDEDLAKAEMLDIMHGSVFLNNVQVYSSSDYSITQDSKICILALGRTDFIPGQSNCYLVKENAKALKCVIPKLVKHSPDTILLVVTNPVDAMTYWAWRVSKLPRHKVIGSGCMVDTARLKFLLSEKFKVAPSSCHGYVIGQHADNPVVVWSSLSIGGIKLTDANPNISYGKEAQKLQKQLVDAGYEIKHLKGYNNWAIGISTSAICQEILNDSHNICSVTVCAQGIHNIKEEVFLSLPVVLGGSGVMDVVEQKLTTSELQTLKRCKEGLLKVQKSVECRK